MVTKINTKIIKCTRCSNLMITIKKEKTSCNNNSNEYYAGTKILIKYLIIVKILKKYMKILCLSMRIVLKIKI